jgi:CheY-like chemotaxis protein
MTGTPCRGFSFYGLAQCDGNFLELIASIRPHVIMLDFRFSGEDCIRLCREIKTVYPHLPVLALSCNSNINEVYDQHGFDNFIPTPFDLEELYKILRQHIPEKQSGR